MIEIRTARESDAEAISEVFMACYQGQYRHPEFLHPEALKRRIFDDDTLLLAAVDSTNDRILGTGSVILDVGAFGDLLGEFGRLAVHPDGRRRGIGHLLMNERIRLVENRLHVAIVDNRASHPFSQKISAAHGFSPVGFLPSKMLFSQRESISLYARLFGNALELRRNHPPIIPEVYPLACEVLRQMGCPRDVVVDDETPSYPLESSFDLEEMTSHGYTSLLHFERGRLGHREIVGPVKLHAGFFQLKISRYQYLLARQNGNLLGGIGFHIHKREEAARLLELVSVDEKPIRFLLEEAVKMCRQEGRVKYIEVDVNAHAPAMQRTLLEMGFLPAAYIPAMTFHRVERFDVIRMVRLLTPIDFEEAILDETAKGVAGIVIDQFRAAEVIPQIAACAAQTPLFAGLTPEQAHRLAAIADLDSFEMDEPVTVAGQSDGRTLLLLEGTAEVILPGAPDQPVGTLQSGDTAGEISLLTARPHSASITATSRITAAVFKEPDISQLVRKRPDIGVILYQNLARQLGDRLTSASQHIAD